MKVLRKIFMIIGIAFASILLIILLAIGFVSIFQDELTDFTIDQLESTIDAPISLGKVSVAPFFSFPRLSAEIHELYVGDPNNLNGDTLLFINSLKVGLDSWGLFNGKYTIEEMKISGLDFDYIIDSLGKTNLDFIIEVFSDSSANELKGNEISPLDIDAKKVALENILVRYSDERSKIAAKVLVPKLSVKAKTKKNVVVGKAEGSLIISDCNLDNTSINLMESCDISFEVDYNDIIAEINKLSIKSDGFDISIEGNTFFSDTLSVNAIVESRDLNIAVLKRYFPDQLVGIIPENIKHIIDFISVDINMDYHEKNLFVEKLHFDSEVLEFALNGNVNIDDSIYLNTMVNKLKLNLDILKGYIPESYLKEYGIVDIGGDVSINAKVIGTIADSTVLPGVDGEVKISEVMIQTYDFPKIDAFNLSAKIKSDRLSDINNTSVDIVQGEIISSLSSVKFQGSLNGLVNTEYSLSSDLILDLSILNNFLPDSIVQSISGRLKTSINSSGLFSGEVNNEFIETTLQNTTATMTVSNLVGLLFDSIQVDNFSTHLKYEPNNSGFKNLLIANLDITSSTLGLDLNNSSLSSSVKGDLFNPEDLTIILKSVKLQSGSSKIIANGNVHNLLNPDFNFVTNINLDLSDLKSNVPDSLISYMDGNVVAYIRSEGTVDFDSIESQILPIIFNSSNLDIACKDVNLTTQDTLIKVNNLNTRIGLRNDVISIDNLSGSYGSLDFSIDSTTITNIYSALIMNQKSELYLNANINLGEVKYNDFKHLIPSSDNESSSDSSNVDGIDSTSMNDAPEVRNWTYTIHGTAGVESIIIDSATIKQFRINRLHINDLSTLFLLNDTSAVLDQFKFKVFDGEVDNSFKYKVRNDGTQSISSHNIIKNINIRTMLKDMDNFGMDSLITYENISGIFSTDLHAFIPIDDSVRIDKMMVSGDLTLEKGGVFNYAPATEVSRFTNIKELDNIQFKTLRSNVFMFKNKLYVPRTNIVSNAIDIAAFGMQDLDGDCQYHLELNLSNILFGKSKRRNKKQDSGGDEIEEESLKKRYQKVRYSIFAGKSKVGPDTKDAREEMMNKIRVQKKMLDFIFFPKNIHYDIAPKKASQ